MIPGIVAASRRAPVASLALWTPLDMSVVPQIYLDAQDSVVTDVSGFASAISNLGAMGSNGNFSQATAGNRPSILSAELGGKRVLRFDGTNDVLTASTSEALALFRNVPAAWVFSVHKKRSTDGSPTSRIYFYSLNGSGGWRTLITCGDTTTGSANKITLHATRLDGQSLAKLEAPSATSGSYFLSLSSINFATREAILRQNGTQVAANATLTTGTGNTSDTAASGALGFGGFSTGVSTSDVDVAALVVGNTQPTLTEFQKLEGWAAHKYGLTASLPGGHPYKTTPPYA
jgi:hypothetical protein